MFQVHMYMYSDAIEHCMEHSKSSDITESYVSPSIVLPPCEQGHGIVPIHASIKNASDLLIDYNQWDRPQCSAFH